MTISFFIRDNSAASDSYQDLLQAEDTDVGSCEILIARDFGDFECRVVTGGTLEVEEPAWGPVAGDGVFHNVALRFGPVPGVSITRLELFIDGTRRASADGLTGPYETCDLTNTPLQLNPDAHGHDVLLDELRVYRRALTDAEIQALSDVGEQP